MRTFRLHLALFAVLLAGNARAAGVTASVLHAFGAGTDGFGPVSGLSQDALGLLYGTTTGGGTQGGGTAYVLFPDVFGPGGGWIETDLHDFAGANVGTYDPSADGSEPSGGLTFDGAGNAYGATVFGGESGDEVEGCGTVYELVRPPLADLIHDEGKAQWPEQVLFRFPRNAGVGCFPSGGVHFGPDGSLFVRTMDGTIWHLTPPIDGSSNWSGTIISVVFAPLIPGAAPDIAVDGSGTVYDTAFDPRGGDGTGGGEDEVFALTPPPGGGGLWTRTPIGAGPSYEAGADPSATLSIGGAGTLYVTTVDGGIPIAGTQGSYGVDFSLTKPSGGATTGWTETVLHDFTGGPDGNHGSTPLVAGPGGTLYGAAVGDDAALLYTLTHDAGGAETKSNLDALENTPLVPGTGLVVDALGSVYGTLQGGTVGGFAIRVVPPGVTAPY